MVALRRRVAAFTLACCCLIASGCLTDVWSQNDCVLSPGLCGSLDQTVQPTCTDPRPLSLEIGSGADTFAPLQGTAFSYLVHGPQNGTHVWVALRVVGAQKGRRLRAAIRAYDEQTDCKTGDWACQGRFAGNRDAILDDGAVGGNGVLEQSGLQMFGSFGDEVWARVVDQCGREAVAFHVFDGN